MRERGSQEHSAVVREAGRGAGFSGEGSSLALVGKSESGVTKRRLGEMPQKQLCLHVYRDRDWESPASRL